MNTPGHDWRTLLLAGASTGAAVLSFVLAASLMGYAALGPANLGPRLGSPKLRELIVLASAVSLIGALFVAASYYGIKSLLGHQASAYAPQPLRSWQGAALLCAWIASALLAQVLSQHNTLAWLAPAFYLVAIATPAYFFFRLAAGGLHPGSRGRIWGILATSMAASTSLALLVEAALLIVGVLVVGIYLALDPAQLASVEQFARQLASASAPEDAIAILKPLLDRPVILLLGLLIVSVLTPAIEETTKAVAVWTVFDHLDSAAQGFVAGALSGAGFALVESLLASATPDSNWALTLVVRGGSTMMHIMAASLTGWGIGSFRTRRRAGLALGAYGLALGLHGLWNASVLAVAFGGARTAFNLSGGDPLGRALMFAGGAMLILLCITIPIALAVINSRLRSATHANGFPGTADKLSPGRLGPDDPTAASER